MKNNKKPNLHQQRSEEVQEILSRPPSWIIQWGSTVLFAFFALLIAIACIVPSPNVIEVNSGIARLRVAPPVTDSTADTLFVAEIKLDQVYIGKVQPGQPVVIKLKAYNYNEFGTLNGRVAWVSDSLNKKDGKADAFISIPKSRRTSKGFQIKYMEGLQGQATIIIREQKLIQKVNPF